MLILILRPAIVAVVIVAVLRLMVRLIVLALLVLVVARIQILRSDDANSPLGSVRFVRLRLFVVDGRGPIANNIAFFQFQLRRLELIFRKKRTNVRTIGGQQLLIEHEAPVGFAANFQIGQCKVGVDRPQFQHQLSIERHGHFFLFRRRKLTSGGKSGTTLMLCLMGCGFCRLSLLTERS